MHWGLLSRGRIIIYSFSRTSLVSCLTLEKMSLIVLYRVLKLPPGRKGTTFHYTIEPHSSMRCYEPLPIRPSQPCLRPWQASGTAVSKASPSAATFWWRSAYARLFGRLLAPSSQRVDLLFENLPLPLPPFAGDDSTMHAAGECTASTARVWLSRAMAPASDHPHSPSLHIHALTSSSFLKECVCPDSLSCASRRPS